MSIPTFGTNYKKGLKRGGEGQVVISPLLAGRDGGAGSLRKLKKVAAACVILPTLHITNILELERGYNVHTETDKYPC